jgi:hypothetical protein
VEERAKEIENVHVHWMRKKIRTTTIILTAMTNHTDRSKEANLERAKEEAAFRYPESGMNKDGEHSIPDGANYFYYVCPKDLIRKDEVMAAHGLIYIREDGFVEIVKKPRRLHDNQFTNWKMLANKMYWRFRQLWREKYIAKEISRDEYYEGFNLSMTEDDNPKYPQQP